MAKKSIQQMAEERYSHPDVVQAVLKSVEQAGTEKDILAGKLHLPSEYDAARHTAGVDVHEEAMRQERSQTGRGQRYNPDEHSKSLLRLRELTGSE